MVESEGGGGVAGDGGEGEGLGDLTVQVGTVHYYVLYVHVQYMYSTCTVHVQYMCEQLVLISITG